MPQATYQDYYIGTPRVISQSPRRYLFENNGDLATFEYDRAYAVDVKAYTATAMGTVDPLLAASYLVEQTKPEIDQGRLATFRRTYCRIPTQQIVPVGYSFSSPNYSPVSVGTLTAVASGLAVSGSSLRVGAYALISIVESSDFSGYYGAELAFTRAGSDYTIPSGHGFTVGSIAVFRDTTNGSGWGPVTAFTATTITVPVITTYTGTGTAGKVLIDSVISGTGFLRRRTRTSCHQGAVISLIGRRLEDYYLPGVSAGITTFQDVVPQSGFTLENFLGAYALASTWFNVQATPTQLWRGNMLVQTYQQCRLSDV